MKITSVSMNRPLNKAQGAVKKISPLVKPSTMAVREVDGEGRAPENEALGAHANGHGFDSDLTRLGIWLHHLLHLQSFRPARLVYANTVHKVST